MNRKQDVHAQKHFWLYQTVNILSYRVPLYVHTVKWKPQDKIVNQSIKRICQAAITKYIGSRQKQANNMARLEKNVVGLFGNQGKQRHNSVQPGDFRVSTYLSAAIFNCNRQAGSRPFKNIKCVLQIYCFQFQRIRNVNGGKEA